MSDNPRYNAFALGKAFAEVLSERLEDTFSTALSELSKFNAEQQEKLRLFTEEVMTRAEQQSRAQASSSSGANATGSDGEAVDLQATIDNLRASIASLRTELKAYKASTTPQ